jgi:alanine dehydrogenase
MLKLGIIGKSYKENEKRLPIHPADFSQIDEKYRGFVYIDKDYGINFGYSDDELRPYVADILDKSDIYKICDVILTLKYVKNDYLAMEPNKICWGWHHLVQNKQNVDLIVEKKLTAVSIEQMFENGVYILNENRKMAGYASILHAFQLKGLTGYTDSCGLKVAVLGYGHVGKGAVDGLLTMGVRHIDVYTNRDPSIVGEKRNGCVYYQFPQEDWKETLSGYDQIVCCVLQDPLKPLIFLRKSDLDDLDKKLFIIDISCDEGMGFDFAVQTTIDNPIIRINRNVDFYGVDHSPSIYYNTITTQISKKMIHYIPMFIENKIYDNPVIRGAVEIDRGVVVNEVINRFQNRK